MPSNAQHHILVAQVQDQPGVLNRVTSLFRRRMFNIESLTVGHTDQPGVSRMTVVVDGARTSVEQVTKQLYKLIEVTKVSEVTQESVVAHELALIKVSASAGHRPEVLQLASVYNATVVHVTPDAVLIEATGPEDKIDALVSVLRTYGIKEMVRTGVIAMTK
ncbi:MAG: acetolactate synthase small subunit [Chloroflexi bacterium]|nr:acetolactate synthase small subunit [Chloroflexota bacterium]